MVFRIVVFFSLWLIHLTMKQKMFNFVRKKNDTQKKRIENRDVTVFDFSIEKKKEE